MSELDKQKDKPFDKLDLLSASTSNNISVLTYGKRFEYDDEEEIQQDYLTRKSNEGSAFVGFATAMPFMVKLLIFIGNRKYQLFVDCVEKTLAFDGNQIQKHLNPEYDHIYIT